MSTTETAPHGAEETVTADPAQGETTTEPTPDEKPAQATDWEAEAKKWEKRAKENGSAAKELNKLRQESMSETERAVSEAEERGRMAATSTFASRLARKEFDALAGRRNPDIDTDEVLEFMDLSKFVGEDGEPNLKNIQAAVERLVPEAPKEPGRQPSFDSGSRTTAPTGQSFSDIIRKQAGH